MSAQAAAEPSMEDILASIRKIISEDNPDQDSTLKTQSTPSNSAGEPAAPVTHFPDATQPVENSEQPIPAVMVERREDVGEARMPDNPAPTASNIQNTSNYPDNNHARQAATPVPGFIEKKPELTRQDAVVAKANNAPVENHPVQNLSEVAGSTRRDTHRVEPGNTQEQNSIQTNEALHPEIEKALNSQEKPVFQNSDTMPMGQSSPALLSPETLERREEEERRNHPLRRGADRESEEFSRALMSPQTDDAVGNAFEQLKNSATDNLDGKVEALLRPMLREWLDNNLPSMVERLVRDEIERVSRGE